MEQFNINMHKSGGLSGDFADDKRVENDDNVTKTNEISRIQCIFQHKYTRCWFVSWNANEEKRKSKTLWEKNQKTGREETVERDGNDGPLLRNKRRESWGICRAKEQKMREIAVKPAKYQKNVRTTRWFLSFSLEKCRVNEYTILNIVYHDNRRGEQFSWIQWMRF